MKPYTHEELTRILEQHARWMALGRTEGERANLSGANLWGANLSGANLWGANLRGANLGDTRVIQLGPLGSRHDYLVVVRHPDASIQARTGCFLGTLEDLAAAVARTHADHPPYRREYEAAIDYARTVLEPLAEVSHGH